MKKMIAVIMMAIMATGLAVANEGHDVKNMKNHEMKNVKVQTICPVMKKPVNKNLYVDYKGKRIYVCCKSCIKIVKKNPEKWIKKLESDGVTVAKVVAPQATCPVMGGKINKAQYADVNGKRIYVCCPGCIAKVKANPEKYIKKLEAEGVVLENTPKKLEKKAASDDHRGHKH